MSISAKPPNFVEGMYNLALLAKQFANCFNKSLRLLIGQPHSGGAFCFPA